MTATDPDAPPACARYAESLRTVLLLRAEPVGVRALREDDCRTPSGFPRPTPAVYYCAAVMRAAAGESFCLGHADIVCDTAPRTLGLEPGFFNDDFIESYVTGGLYADRLRADLVLAGVPVLSGMATVEIAPLRRFTDAQPPDVVVMGLAPYAAMRLAQAAAYRGHRVRNEPIGMHGICAECTAGPLLTGELSLSLLCSGTRHVAGWPDSELAVGVPYALLPEIADGLWESIGRFETDSRKSVIGNRCKAGPVQDRTPSPEALEHGTSYFSPCGPGPESQR